MGVTFIGVVPWVPNSIGLSFASTVVVLSLSKQNFSSREPSRPPRVATRSPLYVQTSTEGLVMSQLVCPSGGDKTWTSHFSTKSSGNDSIHVNFMEIVSTMYTLWK